MSLKRKFFVSLVTPLVITFLSAQVAFAASNVTLKKGMSGSNVTELQKDLKTLGFFTVNPTGYFGDATETAVNKLQRKYGLTADGIAGKKTLGKIDSLQVAETIASRGVTKLSAQTGNLKAGMTGSAVTELQKGLKALGFMDIDPTGYYGDITKAAVKQLQKKYGLVQDGIAGKQTTSKVNTLLGSKTNAATTAKPSTTDNKKTTVSRGASDIVQSIINYAKNFMGVRYRWGGNTAKGFDCSGFTKYVFSHFDISLSRVSGSQAQNGTYIKKANLKPGDLVFFDTNGGSNGINHVGIYIGSGKFIHSSSSHKGVTISTLSSGFYSNSYMTARRVL